jgi:hypothetical protein
MAGGEQQWMASEMGRRDSANLQASDDGQNQLKLFLFDRPDSSTAKQRSYTQHIARKISQKHSVHDESITIVEHGRCDAAVGHLEPSEHAVAVSNFIAEKCADLELRTSG